MLAQIIACSPEQSCVLAWVWQSARLYVQHSGGRARGERVLVPQLDLGFRQVDAQGAPIRRPRADVARLLHLPEERCSTAVLAPALRISFALGPSA